MLVIVAMVLITNVEANECVDDYFDMTPALSMAIRSYKLTINPGDQIEFEIFITGYGHIENITKIFGTFPIGLVEQGSPTYGTYEYVLFNVTTQQYYKTTSNLTYPFYVWKENLYYKQFRNSENCSSVLTRSEVYFNINSIIEAPIKIKINTSTHAPSGDNVINLILTYTDGEKWYQDKEKIAIHINNPIEENRQLLVIISTIVGIILTCISIGNKLEKLYSSWYGKIILIVTIVLIVIILYYIYISV